MSPIPTIAEASRALAAGDLSPVELTRTCLDRVARLEPSLHAFVTLTTERALADAEASRQRYAAGNPRGPLDGIPIGHKDIFCTAGIRTTGQSRLLADNVPTEDAVTVARLAAAGTVLMGKLTTYEFAMGGPSFDLLWPPARNPWGLDRMTAGSSSGTAAAVAAGLVLGGTGSDTGGSVRVPAAHCGIAGLKPTYGLLPRTGILPLSFSLDHAGPMAWTVEDCALLLQAMAGPDAGDPASADRKVPDFRTGLNDGVKGLRIGVVANFHEVDNPANAAVAAAIADAAEIFRAGGAEISTVRLPSLQEFYAVCHILITVEAHAVHQTWLRTRYNEYGELLRTRLTPGGLISGVDYVQATRRRRELCATVAALMADVDILLTTASPTEAKPLFSTQKLRNMDLPPFTAPFNVTGQPAISVCAGYGQAGLPLSLQLAGRVFEDSVVLRAAQFYESETTWRSVRPTLPAQTLPTVPA